jgi:hypothetical protein
MTEISFDLAPSSTVDSNDILADGMFGTHRLIGYFPATLWSNALAKDGTPPMAFLNGALVQARAIYSGAGSEISFEGNIEFCEFNMHLPLYGANPQTIAQMLALLQSTPSNPSPSGSGPSYKLIQFAEILKNVDDIKKNKSIFSVEIEKMGGFQPLPAVPFGGGP